MKPENDNSNDNAHASEQSWWERNVNVLIAGLVIACIGTLVAQFVFSPLFDDHHPEHFKLETVFGFEGVFGFAAFVAAVFLGGFLRLFVKRDEDYYDS